MEQEKINEIVEKIIQEPESSWEIGYCKYILKLFDLEIYLMYNQSFYSLEINGYFISSDKKIKKLTEKLENYFKNKKLEEKEKKLNKIYNKLCVKN
jgi:hypothetical protein